MLKPSSFSRRTQLWTALITVSVSCLSPALTAEVGAFKKDTRPPVDITKEKALYVVGYAHLDTQFRWTYTKTIREFLPNTLTRNFALFEKYPNYLFNFSGSRRYEMMKEYYPADYEKMKKYVAAGRWFPCGSSVDEGDAIVPSLESMVRHVLYGNRFFKREFNMTSQEFMLPDCFGFPASLPTILTHCGIKGFSTQKLTWGSAIGIPFKVGTWIGPDDSSVIAALDPGAYNGDAKEDLSQSTKWVERINKTGSASGAYVDYHYYGTGDCGGAPAEKSVEWIEKSVAGSGPVRVISGNAEEMFKAITPAQKAKLPLYKGELLLTRHSAGSITSQAYLKRWNRKSELLADSAERAAVAAMEIGAAPYPTKKIYDAWDLVLGSQMHDNLPGTTTPEGFEFIWNDYVLAQNKFGAVLTDAASTVASALDTSAKGISLVVYNPLSIPREDIVEAEVKFTSDAPAAIRVIGPDGKPTPAQIRHRNGSTAGIVFLARLPAIGFASYDVQSASEEENSELTVSERSLENAKYRVTINEAGDIASIFDKANGKELLAAPAQLSFHSEAPDEYPAWNMDWKDRQKAPKAFVGGPATFRVIESGPARVALEIQRDSEGSQFVQQVRLGAGAAGDRVEVINRIDWQTRGVSLKAGFPLAVSNPEATYDDKVGTLKRGNNEPKRYEVPQHMWFDLTATDGKYGVAVLNDSKYGSDKPNDNTVRLTLLYTPDARSGYAAGYGDQDSQDLGRHETAYAIVGHAGTWDTAGVPWQASRFNQPLTAFQTRAHPGTLGKQFGLLKLDSDQVEIAALKKSEDGEEIVVRLRELVGKSAKGIRLSAWANIVSAQEIDGQEYPIGQVSLQDGQLVTDLPANGLRAFALKLGSTQPVQTFAKVEPVALDYDLDAMSATANLADGSFDGDGRTFPSELVPAEIVSEGIPFKLGPSTAQSKNAVVCRGQTVALPQGDYNRVYLLAAAVYGDTPGKFTIGDQQIEQVIQDWSGFIGQWDNRLWKGNVLTGLVPGFVKPATVAWYASHRHHPKKGDEHYQYCYLYKHAFELPPGTKTLTLPNNEKIRVFALTVAKDSRATVRAATALQDTLADHLWQAPRFNPEPGKFADLTKVAISALYWKAGALHYTLDGSEPTESSPVYSQPIELCEKTVVWARLIVPGTKGSLEVSGTFDVHDVTAPIVTKADSLVPANLVTVEFSKPVSKKSAENPASYHFEPSVEVISAALSGNGRTAKLTLAKPITAPSSLTVKDVCDLSPQANRVVEEAKPVSAMKKVWSLDAFVADGKTSKQEEVADLPVNPSDSWSINCFVRTDAQPDNRTLIAGFGAPVNEFGRPRYLGKFGSGIHFWASRCDAETNTAMDVGKWQMLSIVYNGKIVRIYKNGEQIGEAELELSKAKSVISLAPLDPWDKEGRFKGEIRNFSVWSSAIPADGLLELLKQMPQ